MQMRAFTTLFLALGLTFGGQVIFEGEASAKPFEILSQSRKGGKRTHKRSKSSSKKGKKGKKKRTSKRRRSSSRRHVRSRTHQNSSRTRKNVRSRRTVKRRRPTSRRKTTTRTRRNVRPRTRTTTRRTRTVRRSRTRRRGSRVRRSYHSRHHHHHGSSSRRSSSRSGGSSAVEAYVTGGLGVSGLLSNEITDLALPGAGYNLAVGAKGKLFGAELGFNGGGYTFDPGNPTTDIGLVGLSGDLKLQPSIAFFEPYVKAGIGGYSLADGVIDETAAGVGLRLGAGADFRYQNVAFRLSYLHGTYGLEDRGGGFGGNLTAHTETLGANLVVYF